MPVIYPPINFKCIVPRCNRSAVGNHAICNLHLFGEVALVVLIVALAIAGVIWLVMKIL